MDWIIKLDNKFKNYKGSDLEHVSTTDIEDNDFWQPEGSKGF